MAAKNSFKGQSETSIEDAIRIAIQSDPKSDPGADIHNYNIAHLNIVWGGFTQPTIYQLTLERP
jgi:hypothetical protein